MIGSYVGAYRLVRELGDGGQSSVFEAVRESDGTQVALKVFHEHLRAELAERARREARLLESIADDGLPRFVELVEDSHGPVAVAMQLVDGLPMTAALAVQAFSNDEKRAFLVELARILAVLHRRGAVHRDVKPGNVLLRAGAGAEFRGRVVLVDLALAKEEVASGATQAGLVMGTPQFLGPEFLLGKRGSTDATAAADVFGWGVIAWLVLFGQHPTGLPLDADPTDFMRAYSAGDQAWLRPTATEALARFASDAGVVTGAIRALRDDPAARPQNGADLLNVLQQWGAPTGLDGLARPGQFTALKVEPWTSAPSPERPSGPPAVERGSSPGRSLPPVPSSASRTSMLPWLLIGAAVVAAAGVAVAALGAWYFVLGEPEPVASASARPSVPAAPAAVPVQPKPAPTAQPVEEPAPAPDPEPAKPPVSGGLVTINVKVTIDTRKPSGAKWDALDTVPEASLTLRVGSSGQVRSAYGGSTHSFATTFQNVYVSPNDKVTVSLMDRDMSAHDSIGSTTVSFGGRGKGVRRRGGAAVFDVSFW